jgi:hypothetical protein
MKKLLYLFLILGAFIGIERLSHALTDGFGPTNITSNLPYNSRWNVTITPEDLEETQQALSQSYHYLKSGSQSFVFISDDKKYILKFFKHKRWRLNPLFEHLPLPSSLDAKRERWKRKKQETVHSTFKSCMTSYQDFKKETGLLYLHLNPTSHLKRTLIVKDRIGFQHQIDLDSIQFLLQRKAIPTDKYLLSLKKCGDLEEAKKAIINLLHFTQRRAQKGYSDKDPHLIRNFGFIKEQVVEIDVGGFHRDPKKDLNYYYNYEIYRIQNKILPWLKKNYPELSSFTKKQIQEMILQRDR